MIEFFVLCVPPKVSHHAKRIIRRGRFASLADKPELTSAKEELLAHFRPFQPVHALDGPLRLSLEYTWPWRASDTLKTRAKAPGRIWLDTKPDVDNLAKTTIDTLAALGFFVTDSRICYLAVAKYVGEKPGIGVLLRRAE